jgi:hypothetical protein
MSLGFIVMRFRNLKRLKTEEHLLISEYTPDTGIPLDLVCHYHEHSGKRNISAPYAEIPTSGRTDRGLGQLSVATRRAGCDT